MIDDYEDLLNTIEKESVNPTAMDSIKSPATTVGQGSKKSRDLRMMGAATLDSKRDEEIEFDLLNGNFGAEKQPRDDLNQMSLPASQTLSPI